MTIETVDGINGSIETVDGSIEKVDDVTLEDD